MGKKESPLVSIKCLVYNHGPYLRQCLDGFVMQKTNFAFEAIVHDDASTDNSADIIREYAEKYPDIIKPIYETENQYSKHDGSLRRIMDAAIHPDAKYIAICEGDDYWCNHNKLQMQVDYLETHPDYCMVHTDFDLTNGRRNHLNIKKIPEGNYSPYIITNGINIGTLTVMFRLSSYRKIPKYYQNKNWPMGDKPLWIELSTVGKIHYIPTVTAKYRILEESASHSKDINKLIMFQEASLEVKKFYANIYGISLENDGLNTAYYQNLIRYACRTKNKDIAIFYYKQAKKRKMLNLKAYLFYIASKYPTIKKVIELYIKI